MRVIRFGKAAPSAGSPATAEKIIVPRSMLAPSTNPNACVGVICPPGTACDTNGICVPVMGPCTGVICPPNTACDSSGICVPVKTSRPTAAQPTRSEAATELTQRARASQPKPNASAILPYLPSGPMPTYVPPAPEPEPEAPAAPQAPPPPGSLWGKLAVAFVIAKAFAFI